ncbi:MAG: hypothetical protein JSV10_03040 [Candidatus Zixiibacteriota bacterium]|nr:MAG: hypothetical protein JSV10_03040 [candidate division Zixibacteria bacterium]
MKKYLILAIAVAVVALLVVFSLQEKSTAANPSFYGACPEGKTVEACKLPGYFPCYYAVADEYDTYEFPSSIVHGTYRLDNGCTHGTEDYSGSAVQFDFCVPDPPLHRCACL